MAQKLSPIAGGLRNLIAALVVLSFLALVGLLAATGHAPHLFVAVGYLLIAAFALTRLLPAKRSEQREFDPDVGFRPDMGQDADPAGCACCGSDATPDKDTN